nr:putative efflux pump gsfj [Quercus suber]
MQACEHLVVALTSQRQKVKLPIGSDFYYFRKPKSGQRFSKYNQTILDETFVCRDPSDRRPVEVPDTILSLSVSSNDRYPPLMELSQIETFLPEGSLQRTITAVLGLGTVYSLSLVIHRLVISPLSKFPGPKLAAVTSWGSDYYDEVYVVGSVRQTDRYEAFTEGLVDFDGAHLATVSHELHRKRRHCYTAAYIHVCALVHAVSIHPGGQKRRCDQVRLLRYIPWSILMRLDLKAQKFNEFKVLCDDHIKTAKCEGGTSPSQDSFKIGSRPTVLRHLVGSGLPASELSSDRLSKEAQLMIGAGTTTTAGTLNFLTFYVITNPVIRKRLEGELAPLMNEYPARKPSWAELERLPFFQAVIKETLRLSYGTIHRRPRVSPKVPLQYKEWVIPPGVPVEMSAYFAHRDPANFPDPDKFLPERWMRDVTPGMLKNYVPFSKGSRHCPGMRLAYCEINFITAALVRPVGLQFELFDTTEADVKPVHDMIVPLPRIGTKASAIPSRLTCLPHTPCRLHSLCSAVLTGARQQTADEIASLQVESDTTSTLAALARAEKTHDTRSSDHAVSVTDIDSSREKPSSDTAEVVDDSEYPTGARLAAVVAALALAIFLVSLDLTIVATAIPKITDQFHGLSDIAWYSSAFFMTMGGFQSAWGNIYKYFPLKTSYLVAIFIFEFGSLICGVAPSSSALIVGRAIAGLGAAGIGSGSYTIIGFAASPKSRPMFTGIVGTSYVVAAAVGPLIGGAFSDKVSWRWCFYINLPIGAISAFIILIFFQTPSAAKPQVATLRQKLLHLDPIGAALVMAFVVCYLLAMQDGGSKYPWSSAHEVGLLVGSALIVGTFVLWEWYQRDTAMFPFRLAKQRIYIVESVFSFFYSGAYYLVLYYLPIYFQSIDNASAQGSGVRNLPLIVAVVISMLASGGYISASGVAAPIIVVGTILSTMCTGLLYTLDIGTSEGKWIGYQIIGGVGWGVAFQIPIITVQATAPLVDLAEVTATLLFLQTLGGAAMTSAAQAGFINVMLNNLPTTAPGVDPALVVGTGATDLRNVFTEDQIPGILLAYMRGLKTSFAISIASSGIAFFIIVLFQRWNKLNTAAIAGGNAA